MRILAALRVLGRLQLVLGVALTMPILCSLAYGEKATAMAFAISAIATLAVGGLWTLLAKEGETPELYRREGILIVVGGWVLASIFGALPYLLSGALSSPVDALFEAASGFTTTGATVLPDIEAAQRGVLFWRSFTQWLGGMGIIVLFVALLPELGPGARFLYKLEVPGPTAEALHPRIHDTATVVWKIYLMLTAAETVILMILGMDLYDALTHTFSTLSTGGFSPLNKSVAAFESPAIHVVIIVFMVLAGTNFSLFYGMRSRKGVRTLLRDSEFRLYVGLLAGGTVLVATNLLVTETYREPLRALLDAAFQIVAITTTTGFATADFDGWPALSKMTLVVLMFVGGCAGSTAGSMKVMRMVIGLKSAFREVRLMFSPNSVLPVLVGGKAVPDGAVRAVAGFFILFLSLWGFGAFLLTIGGTDIVTASTASIATLGNIGPGLEGVGPTKNFVAFSPADKAIMVLLMWLGRLEVYAIAATFSRAFWRP